MEKRISELRSEIMRAACMTPEFHKLNDRFHELEVRVERILQKLTNDEQDAIWEFFYLSEKIDWKLVSFVGRILDSNASENDTTQEGM